jgi:hypothetical protein
MNRRAAPLTSNYERDTVQEHWLHDKLEEGRILILEDESIWEIHPSDRHTAQHWLRISTIMVKYTQKEGHPYLLSKTLEGEVARANYVGNSPHRMNVAAEVA